MGLSRLDNFLKSVRGTIIYVDPNSLDATDSIENQGNSLTRPFKTIQRALIEASRFSYQRGLNNDRFGKTTILLYPGDHIVDNRPGWIPDASLGSNTFRLRNGTSSTDFSPFDLTTNFDLTTVNNALYKLNSIHGGVIVPRGTSIVGLDLRKTKIRPKYIPNPENDDIARSTIFRVTGGCYFWQFSIFDADPNGQCYIDYNNNLFVPNFSHHKLTCFEYADGVNDVYINDLYFSGANALSYDRTDLEMYYEKVGLAYGQSSGRAIEPDYPSSQLDIQPKIDEYRIVGPTGGNVGITSIKAGNGTTPTTTITVTTASAVSGLDVDTGFRIRNVSEDNYNGQFVVTERIDDTNFKYQVQNVPATALPTVTSASLTLSTDTVTSASPYIFNISLRSVYGMCGVLADGDKASGFKSMVIAQFTGIGLQKDDNAFVKYDSNSGTWKNTLQLSKATLSNDSRAIFKPSYRNFHIKTVNEAFVQNVSIFAIGYAEHFATESGGDQSVTNSNSNFGAKALVASGFRKSAFPQDDLGYITHIIPPKELPLTETAIEFNAIDVNKTLNSISVGVGSTGNLYLYNQTNIDTPPENVLEGYRIGARENDALKVLVSSGGSVTEYSARIVMPGSQSSSEKKFAVARVGTANSITNGNTLNLTSNHTFTNGESVRVVSENGLLPDGLAPNTVYYALTSGLSANQLKLTQTQSDALTVSNPIDINEVGGVLSVVSRVTDKNSGDIGHPIQYDSTNSQWYIRVASASTENSIYSTIVGLGSTGLGLATPRTYFKRRPDNRGTTDTLYRVRYVIPKSTGATVARPPSDAFILQESNTSIGSTNGEVATYFGSGSISSVNEQRNFRFVANAVWDGASTVDITTELPHNLVVGSQVELVNIKSTKNTTGIANTGFNRTYSVSGISSAKQFSVGLTTDPGTFTSDTSARTTSLPYFKRKQYKDIYYVYRTQEAQKYVAGQQDGIYYITVLNASNSPTVSPFTDEKFSQPVKELYPQINRDNPKSDPDASTCAATSSLIGEVVVNDVRNSITRETVNKFLKDADVGVGLTDIISDVGNTTHTIRTNIDHGLNRIVQVSITNAGAGYGSGAAGDIYNARLVGFAGSTTGSHATAKITVNGSGTITDVKIMDGGSAYGIGNTLAVVGVATTTGYSQAVLTVSKIYNNVNDTVRITGISSEAYIPLNDVYRITNVEVGAAKSFVVTSTSAIGIGTTTGIASVEATNAFVYLTGEAIRVSALSYNNLTGIATVTSVNNHGLKVDSKVRIVGANESLYNGDFVVTENVSNTSFKINVGLSTYAPAATGTLFAYREGVTSNDGVITVDNENLNGRMNAIYAGITTTLSSAILNATTDQINLQNESNLDVNIGDYLMIDDEIVRIKTTTASSVTGVSNPIYVFRGVLGTKATSHLFGAVVRKIQIKPIELRRHSIIRASGHTFEYVGFGPGNYSTAFPDKQDRQISAQEELLSQSTRKAGGINFYTGMNDRGISYSGNKKMSSITGLEEIFDTPIQTITGEDIGPQQGLNVISPTEGSFARSIRVEGGSDGKATSEFNGPVIFSNKLTSTSTKGVEAFSLFLQGDSTVSRKYTVGIATPALAGNPGDIVYLDNPSRGGYVGWIYTTDNDWYRFGAISLSKNLNVGLFDQVGIATTSPGTAKLLVGSGTTQFSVDGNGGVGIGTTANTFKLNVNGNTNIAGTCYATSFSGDGSALSNVNVSAAGWTQITGGLYNTSLNNVGIGTSVPRFNLELGNVGTSSTSLYVNGIGKFVGILTANDVFVSGASTIVGTYEINNVSSGIIRASSVGIATTNPLTALQIGTASASGVPTNGYVFAVTGIGSVGVGTTAPRAHLDIEGHTRLKTYSENVEYISVAAGIAIIDLSKAQSFICTATSNITEFALINRPSGSTEFTLRIDQDSTGNRQVGIDTFKTSGGGSSIPVYWPGGGVLPGVTTTANRSDIYAFKTFDGTNITSSGLYGVVVGQNFA